MYGIDACPVDVEVDLYKSGMGKDFTLVGMPDTAVREARERIKSALSNAGFFYPNKAVTIAHMPSRRIRTECTLDPAGERTLELAVRKMSLSARAHDRILKVARTIADLDTSPSISAKHIAEAVQYRSLDRSYWT